MRRASIMSAIALVNAISATAREHAVSEGELLDYLKTLLPQCDAKVLEVAAFVATIPD